MSSTAAAKKCPSRRSQSVRRRCFPGLSEGTGEFQAIALNAPTPLAWYFCQDVQSGHIVPFFSQVGRTGTPYVLTYITIKIIRLKRVNAIDMMRIYFILPPGEYDTYTKGRNKHRGCSISLTA